MNRAGTAKGDEKKKNEIPKGLDHKKCSNRQGTTGREEKGPKGEKNHKSPRRLVFTHFGEAPSKIKDRQRLAEGLEGKRGGALLLGMQATIRSLVGGGNRSGKARPTLSSGEDFRKVREPEKKKGKHERSEQPSKKIQDAASGLEVSVKSAGREKLRRATTGGTKTLTLDFRSMDSGMNSIRHLPSLA